MSDSLDLWGEVVSVAVVRAPRTYDTQAITEQIVAVHGAVSLFDLSNDEVDRLFAKNETFDDPDHERERS